jgi:nucleoside-diphosphate-sugar epimerase
MTTPAGLVLVTGGSGYIAVLCIAQLLQEGWRVRTTIRSLAKAEQVRASVSKIGGDRICQRLGPSGRGADYVLHVASPVPMSRTLAFFALFLLPLTASLASAADLTVACEEATLPTGVPKRFIAS